MNAKIALFSILSALRSATPKLLLIALLAAMAVITLDHTSGSGNAWAQRASTIPGKFMSVTDAHQMALQKKLILLDIRRPEEWRQSGVPATASPLTMHQSAAKFFGGLDALTLMDKSRAIGLICATGVRTTYLQKILSQRGYTNIINVAEGMFGSRHGKGWIKSGLPLKQYGKGGAATSKTPTR